jgi:hypothetical protein
MSVQLISAVSKSRDRIVGVIVGLLSSSKTVWLEIKIMFLSGGHVYPWIVVSVSKHNTNQTKHEGQVQRRHHHQNLIYIYCSRKMAHYVLNSNHLLIFDYVILTWKFRKWYRITRSCRTHTHKYLPNWNLFFIIVWKSQNFASVSTDKLRMVLLPWP